MTVMNAHQIVHELEQLGTEQARKTYQRHGVGENVLGVSYSDLGKFQKKLKMNHAVALDLWASGIHDAQILALMIADPQQADPDLLDRWAATLTNYVITDAFSAYVARTPVARQKAEAWIESDHEWTAAAGWDILGQLASNDAALPDSYFEPYLARIERDLHGSKNRTRHSMNNALISIGARSPALQPNAVAAARRVGKVVVDHGLTNCKTPDAISYMQKVIDHREKKAAKARVKA